MMEASGEGRSDDLLTVSSPSSSSSSSSRTFGVQFPALNFFQSPLSVILEYSGIVPPTQSQDPAQPPLIIADPVQTQLPNCPPALSAAHGDGEVSIRIIGSSEGNVAGESGEHSVCDGLTDIASTTVESEELLLGSPSSPSTSLQGSVNSEEGDLGSGNGSGRDSAYQRYELQQVGRWIEQILPFSLLLLVVFIRQHLQGFFITIWVAAVMFKSNDIIRKQTALKGERRNSVLVFISSTFALYVVGIYWWYHNDNVLYPLLMLPPKAPPPFWHAIFIIMLNDIMVRQAAMALKCLLLMYYKNGRGHNFRRQGQMLTLVEYGLLLYRALLPTPVWYRFFLNKDYGSLFSSLTTGLYLTFKLTSVIDKVRSFIAAIKALSHKEVHYGSHATKEQVNAAGDLCAICQEKMHVPILLRCKHIFCEECVSEWFERERTCPLCRALVKSADLQSFGDGSTTLFFQVF
ncbi:E3 ubiquitin-protein ligase RNFT1-like [Punica granatum]|uniref:E3 ubiquitin-protein ligase RNFT1-like n=2 Tax=Punica granatum TaxID=22663 RepID=A0A6P8CJT3_PUNGR|nr:E3 ubiquitin-protein ligase RNFT1-like [Punica granatum]